MRRQQRSGTTPLRSNESSPPPPFTPYAFIVDRRRKAFNAKDAKSLRNHSKNKIRHLRQRQERHRNGTSGNQTPALQSLVNLARYRSLTLKRPPRRWSWTTS